MHRLVQAISKMFVVLVLLFGSPPSVSLHQLRRRPVITLVATAHQYDNTDVLALTGRSAPPDSAAAPRTSQTPYLWWGQPHLVAEPEARRFYPVQAA